MNTQLFSIEAFFQSLPKAITNTYSAKSFISINHHNAILAVEEKSTGQSYILKVLDKKYYHKSLYQKIFALTDSNLLLPEFSISDSAYACSLYPKMLPLTEVLSTKGINYSMIHILISDIGNAVNMLHRNQILHLDITPNNIFMNREGRFYLGDFSSSRFAKKTASPLFHPYPRTGGTPAFSPPPEEKTDISYWNDCYSLALLFYMLCNDGSFPDEKGNSISPFHPLLAFLEKTLQKPDSIHQNLIEEFIEKTESLFTICGKDSACRQYHFQTDSNTQDAYSTSVFENLPAENSSLSIAQILHSFAKSVLSIPAPLYGLLFLCGFIFIFSLSRHLAGNRDTDTAILSSDNFAYGDNSFPQTSPSAAAARSPVPSPVPPKETLPSSKKTVPLNAPKTDFILRLSKIDCQDNSFQAKLSGKPSAKILFANHCHITDTTLFSGFKNLEELYLFDNTITVPRGLHVFSKLKILVLSKNKITSLTPLSKLTSLTMLDLSHNHHLKQITSLAGMTNLQILILTNTNATQKEINYLQKKLPDCMIFY